MTKKPASLRDYVITMVVESFLLFVGIIQISVAVSDPEKGGLGFLGLGFIILSRVFARLP